MGREREVEKEGGREPFIFVHICKRTEYTSCQALVDLVRLYTIPTQRKSKRCHNWGKRKSFVLTQQPTGLQECQRWRRVEA